MKCALVALLVALSAFAFIEACSPTQSSTPSSGGSGGSGNTGGRKRRDANSAVATVVTNLPYDPLTLENNLKLVQKQLKHIADVSNVKGNELGKVERRVESKEGYIAVVYTVPNADGKCGQLAALTEKAVQKADLVSYGTLVCAGQNYEFSH